MGWGIPPKWTTQPLIWLQGAGSWRWSSLLRPQTNLTRVIAVHDAVGCETATV